MIINTDNYYSDKIIHFTSSVIIIIVCGGSELIDGDITKVTTLLWLMIEVYSSEVLNKQLFGHKLVINYWCDTFTSLVNNWHTIDQIMNFLMHMVVSSGFLITRCEDLINLLSPTPFISFHQTL